MNEVNPLILESAHSACCIMINDIFPQANLTSTQQLQLEKYLFSLGSKLEDPLDQPAAIQTLNFLGARKVPNTDEKTSTIDTPSQTIVGFFMNRIVKIIKNQGYNIEKIRSATKSFLKKKIEEDDEERKIKSPKHVCIQEPTEELNIEDWHLGCVSTSEIDFLDETSTSQKSSSSQESISESFDASQGPPPSSYVDIDKEELGLMFEDELRSRLSEPLRQKILLYCENDTSKIESSIDAIGNIAVGLKKLFLTLLEETKTTEECCSLLQKKIDRGEFTYARAPIASRISCLQRFALRDFVGAEFLPNSTPIIEKVLQNKQFLDWMDLYFANKKSWQENA